MKAKIILFILLITPFFASAQTLIASWQFNGNANDASGNHLDGTAYNCTMTAGKDGIPNTAYQFNGNSSFISVPYSALLNLSTWTIQATVRIDGFNSQPCQDEFIMTRGVSWSTDFMNIGINDDSYDNSCTVYSPNYNEFVPFAAGNSGGGYDTGHYLIQHAWYCHAATYDGAYVRSFVNGVFVDSVPWTQQYVFTGLQDSLVFGYYPAGLPTFPYWFNGAIDNVSIYSGVLSDGQIAANCFSTGVTNVTSSTDELALYPNPNKGDFNITGAFNSRLADIQIINSIGQTILEKQVTVSNEYLNESISVSALPPGMYFVRISGEETKTLRFVVGE